MLTCDELWSCKLTYEEVWFGNEDIYGELWSYMLTYDEA